FRNHVKQLLSGAHEEARRAGYASDDVKLAIYAIVMFLDESILNSPLPALAGWSRKPLQEELFGEHMGGESFFENLRTLIAGLASTAIVIWVVVRITLGSWISQLQSLQPGP